jgi:hypothetical protein
VTGVRPCHPVRLFVELAVETGGGGGSEDVMEQADFAVIKLPTQKIQGIPKCHIREERDDIKADQNVVRLNLESA